jgi:hypothetical protein
VKVNLHVISIRVLVAMLFFAGGTVLSAQQVHTYVDSDSLQVGDIFELTIVVDGAQSLTSYPTSDDFEDDLELLSRERYRPVANRDSIVYKIQFFATEDITIERKPIVMVSQGEEITMQTSRVPLFFKTSLAEDDTEFRPLKPIFDFARSILPWILALVLLAVAGYLLYRWMNRKGAPSQPKQQYNPQPFSDPLVQLKQELANLPQPSGLTSFEQFENYYILLGDSIRRYLKRVHEIPALEMTTAEITSAMRNGFVTAKTISITRTVLNSADMVKFAHFEPTAEQAESTLQKAKEFVDIVQGSDLERINEMRAAHEELETEKVKQSNLDDE